MIELYLKGERDLIQTVAELQDNHELGMSDKTLHSILNEAIRACIKSNDRNGHERLVRLQSLVKLKTTS
jgi:hypothetical protein